MSSGSGSARRPRLVDVASLAEVSVAVVSRVINADPTLSVRDDTRERILAAADQLGYIPNAFGRGLKLARTMTIGIVLSDVDPNVHSVIIRAAERRAHEAGYVLLSANSAEFGPAEPAYSHMLMQGRLDGLILGSASVTDSQSLLRQSAYLPMVLLNRRSPAGITSVSLDDEAAATVATEHLLSLGHRRIAFVGGPTSVDTNARRYAGYRGALRAAGVPVPRSAVVHVTELGEHHGVAAAASLLRLREPPTAVFAASFVLALGVMAGARSAGVSVPSELSVVGLQDPDIAAFLSPPLTTVRLALEQMASDTVDVLLRMVNGEPAESRVVLEPAPYLALRESTSRPPH